VITQVQSLVGAQGAQMVNTLVTNASRPRAGLIATAIGIAALFFGATGVFIQLKDALNTIWEVAPRKDRGVNGMIRERLSGLVMILGLGFLMLVSLVISTVLSVVNSYFTHLLGNSGIASMAINYGVQLVVIAFIFGAIFKWVPDVDIRFSDVWVGALVTAALFLVGQYLISLYLSKASPASAYGAAGSLIVLLLWVYYSAQILFLGAEFTQVYAKDRGTVISPSANARPLTDTERSQQGLPRREKPVERVQEVMIPISGEPAIHPQTSPAGSPRERIRYTPPNANSVVPVIAAGTLAGIYTVGRIVRRVFD
jgi:membrane protein